MILKLVPGIHDQIIQISELILDPGPTLLNLKANGAKIKRVKKLHLPTPGPRGNLSIPTEQLMFLFIKPS